MNLDTIWLKKNRKEYENVQVYLDDAKLKKHQRYLKNKYTTELNITLSKLKQKKKNCLDRIRIGRKYQDLLENE